MMVRPEGSQGEGVYPLGRDNVAQRGQEHWPRVARCLGGPGWGQGCRRGCPLPTCVLYLQDITYLRISVADAPGNAHVSSSGRADKQDSCLLWWEEGEGGRWPERRQRRIQAPELSGDSSTGGLPDCFDSQPRPCLCRWPSLNLPEELNVSAMNGESTLSLQAPGTSWVERVRLSLLLASGLGIWFR